MAIEVGTNVKGVITNITNFGAFVELEDKKTGLIHISEIADHYVKDINDEVERNQEVEVKVLKIEDNGNIALSLKQSGVAQTKPESNETKTEESHKAKPQARESERQYDKKPQNNYRSNSSSSNKKSEGFDDLMSDFLKSSEDRLSSLKRNTESKRGGRGGRRG